MSFALALYDELKALNIKVLLDERNERFGVKINDFELMGFPYALIIGKGLENAELEFIERKSLKKQIFKKDEVLIKLKEILL